MIKIIFYFKMIYHCILGYFFITILRVKITRFEDFLSFEMYNSNIFPYIRTNARSKKEGRDGEGGERGEGEEEEEEEGKGGEQRQGKGKEQIGLHMCKTKMYRLIFAFVFMQNKNN